MFVVTQNAQTFLNDKNGRLFHKEASSRGTKSLSKSN